MATELGPGDELVLALLQDGLRDPEIAVRLGVTIAEARARVERFCARLGPDEYPAIAHRYRLEARREASYEPPAPDRLPEATAAGQQPGLALTAAPVAASLERRHERLGFIPIAGSLAALAAAVGLVGWLAGFEGLSPVPPGPPRASAAASQGEVALTVSGIPFRLVTPSLSTHLSANAGVIVENRCSDSDPTCKSVQSLDRVSSDANAVQRTVIESVSSIPGGSIDGSFVSGDGKGIAVVVDAPGRSPEALVSHDGGATWADPMGLPEFDLQPVGFLGSELVLRTFDGRFVRAPSGRQVDTDMAGVPVGAGNDGQVLFWLGRELFHGDGEWILQPRLPGQVNVSWAAQRPDGTFAVGWVARIGNSQTWVIALLAASGDVSSGLVGLERAPAGFLDATHALLVADRFGNLPASLDLTNGQLSPIVGAFDGYASRAGRFVIGIQRNAPGS